MKRLVLAVVIILYFFGLHTQLAITAHGQLLVPFVLTSFTGLIALGLCSGRVSLNVLRVVTSLAAFALFAAIVTGYGSGAMNQHLISSANFIYSILLGYSIFVAVQTLGLRLSARLFLWLALVFIIGSFLEVYGGLRPVSDAFRNATAEFHASNSGMYEGLDADIRDASLYGGYRPKFFATEPSLVGISTGTFILYWFLASTSLTRVRLMIAGLLTITAFVIIRSPTILLCFVVVLMLYLVRNQGDRFSSRFIVVGFGGLGALIFVPFLISMFTRYGQGGSFIIREVIPPWFCFIIATSHPFLGTGLGGYENWGDYIFQAIDKSGGFSAHTEILKIFAAANATAGRGGARLLVSNGLWEFWIDCGLLGGMIVIAHLVKMFRMLGVRNVAAPFISAAFLATSIGGVTSPVSWVPLFVLAALYQMRYDRQGELEIQPDVFNQRESFVSL